MSKVLIIGAGGVGSVVTKKCAMLPEYFEEICLASRDKAKCDAIAKDLPRPITTAQVDAHRPRKLVALIKSVKPDLVINVALPYQDLDIMDACLKTGVHYLDTASYEPVNEMKFAYHWQWDYHERFKEKGLMALLGCGFEPGMSNLFTAYAKKHHFDEIHYLDIIDGNATEHDQPFASSFNPEVNIRKVIQKGKYFEEGEWITTPALSQGRVYYFPEGIGERNIYLMYHEELESLVKHFPEMKRARFWKTFSDSYLNQLRVLKEIGMTSITPIKHHGKDIIPLQFLTTLLPDPSSLDVKPKGTNLHRLFNSWG